MNLYINERVNKKLTSMFNFHGRENQRNRSDKTTERKISLVTKRAINFSTITD